MKLAILNEQKNKVGEIELPVQFSESFRPDLICRAVHALQSSERQAYGTNPDAGLRHSSKLSKERKHYRGCYGFGISRVNRKILSRRGTRMSWVGAFSPQTRGGRAAHPPQAEKVWEQQINQKENQKAIRSAIAATINKPIVEQRGHKFPAEYPFVIDSTLEKINQTKILQKALLTLGFELELTRAGEKKVRAGKGKLRGRKYKQKKSILLVVGDNCPLIKAAENMIGIEAVPVKSLNVELLAPGTHAGRVTLWSKKALEILEKEKLFI
ncbi:MAG: 50S ribosomal protein L4 [Nanoarchaeota archaeon]